MANEHFGACLKHARTHKMISQNRLAAEAGMTQGTISNYEAGRAIPSEESTRKLAAAMGLVLKATDGNYYFAFPDSERLTEAQLRIIDADGSGNMEESEETDDAVDAVMAAPWSDSVQAAEDFEESAEIEKENLEETAPERKKRPGGVAEDMIIRATLEQIRKEIKSYEQKVYTECGTELQVANDALQRIISVVELMERLVEE